MIIFSTCQIEPHRWKFERNFCGTPRTSHIVILGTKKKKQWKMQGKKWHRLMSPEILTRLMQGRLHENHSSQTAKPISTE